MSVRAQWLQVTETQQVQIERKRCTQAWIRGSFRIIEITLLKNDRDTLRLIPHFFPNFAFIFSNYYMAGNMAASSNSCSFYLTASLPAKQPFRHCSKNLREGFDWLCLGQMSNTGPISYVRGDGARRALPLS